MGWKGGGKTLGCRGGNQFGLRVAPSFTCWELEGRQRNPQLARCQSWFLARPGGLLQLRGIWSWCVFPGGSPAAATEVPHTDCRLRVDVRMHLVEQRLWCVCGVSAKVFIGLSFLQKLGLFSLLLFFFFLHESLLCFFECFSRFLLSLAMKHAVRYLKDFLHCCVKLSYWKGVCVYWCILRDRVHTPSYMVLKLFSANATSGSAFPSTTAVLTDMFKQRTAKN